MTWGFSYKEDRRLIELARDKKKSAEEIAHLMGRPPNTIRRWAVRLGISLRKSKPKSSPRPKAVRASMSSGRRTTGN
jgi:IS30 family transposase